MGCCGGGAASYELVGTSTGVWCFGASSGALYGGVGAEKKPSSLGSASGLPVGSCWFATGTTGWEIPFMVELGSDVGAEVSGAGAISGCLGAPVSPSVAAVASWSTPFAMGAS